MLQRQTDGNPGRPKVDQVHSEQEAKHEETRGGPSADDHQPHQEAQEARERDPAEFCKNGKEADSLALRKAKRWTDQDR